MEKDEIEIDLREVFFHLWANLHIIILATLIGAMAMYLLSSVVLSKKFESSTKMYVLNQQDSQSLTYSDLQTGSQLTKDYAELVKSRTVTSQVIADLNLQSAYADMRDITPDKLAEMISVTTQTDTRILQITVTDTNPTRAQDIADAVRKAAANHIYEVMDIEAVNVVDYANLPEGPVSPNVLKNIIIGALLGFVIAAAIFVIVEITDDTIKTPDDVERYLELSVLASIPYDESMDTEKHKNSRRESKAQQRSAGKRSNNAVPTIKA